jgi:hypothetical protein
MISIRRAGLSFVPRQLSELIEVHARHFRTDGRDAQLRREPCMNGFRSLQLWIC